MIFLYLAIIGNSISFPKLIKFMHDEGIRRPNPILFHNQLNGRFRTTIRCNIHR